MRRFRCSILAALVALAAVPCFSQQKGLTAEQQVTFLASRTTTPMPGTFDAISSYLYAFRKVAIHTESDQVNQARITPTFPSFYQPTWKELFDLIAWQTRSAWQYDTTRGFWVFRDAKRKMPFRIRMATGWEREERSLEIVYRPAIAPVGMDVYWLGSYSSDNQDPSATFDRVREELAMSFVRGFVKDASADKMTLSKAGKLEALYYETSATDSGAVWRQWVVLDGGEAFAIVSAIKPENEKQLLPDVLAMVGSFEIVPPEARSVNEASGLTGEELKLHLISVAVNVVRSASGQNLVGYLAVPIDEDAWETASHDGDLGPFAQLKGNGPGKTVVVLLTDSRSPAYGVYYEGETAVGYAVQMPRGKSGPPPSLAESYRTVTPDMTKAVGTPELAKGNLTTDEAKTMFAYKIKRMNP